MSRKSFWLALKAQVIGLTTSVHQNSKRSDDLNEKCENFIIRMKAKRGKKGEKKKQRFPQRQIDNNESQSFANRDDRTRYFKNHCKIQNLGT